MTVRPSSSLLMTCMVLLLQQQVSKRLEKFILFAVLYAIYKSLKENKHQHDHDDKKKFKFSKQSSFQRALNVLKQSKLQTFKQWQQGIMVSPFHGLTHYYENMILNPSMSYRDKMKYEWKRFETFRQAPARLLESAIKLAKDGIYYTGEDNICKCAFCNHHFDELGEDLTDQHRRLCPDCPLVSNRTLPTNISISNELPMVESINLEPLNQSQRLHLWGSKVIYQGYTNYFLRILSFENFPDLQLIRKLNLVDAGFFYTGNDDHVKCFHCGIGLREWEDSDDPYVEHARFSPNCRHLKEKKGQDFIDSVQRLVKQAEKECKKTSAGNNEICLPTYKCYAVLPARTASFKDWPTSSGQAPEELAQAGFFYVGKEDDVRCFFCGCGLGDWENDDVPWLEHAKWFPECVYLKQQIGSDIVDQVQRRHMEEADDRFQLRKGLVGLTPKKIKNLMMLPAISNLKVMGISKNDIELAVDKYLKQSGDLKFTTENLVHHLPENIRLMKAPRENPYADAPHSEDIDQLLGINQQRKDITKCLCCNKNQISMCFVDCSHAITCAECGENFDVCPRCNKKIRRRVKFFLC